MSREPHRSTTTFYRHTCILFGVLCGLWSAQAHAGQKCKSLFLAKAYARAGDCFRKLVKTVPKHPQWRKDQQLFQDRFLRQAAQSYTQAARQATGEDKSLFYQELAAKMFLRSFTKGTCMATSSCRMHRMRYEKLKEKIGYTALNVLTGDERARIEVQGFQFKQQATHAFHGKLRPGQYTILITSPRIRKQTRRVALKAGAPLTINVTPTTIIRKERRILVPKKLPPLIISGYVAGSLMAASGVGMVIFGILERQRINDILSDPKTARELPPDQAKIAFQRAETVQTIGFVIGFSGLAFVVGAGIAHMALRRDVQPARPSTQPAPTKGMTHLQYSVD